MRILLVEPPFHAFMHYDRWYYPYALAQLAAEAFSAGHEVAIYDADKYFHKDLETKNRSVHIDNQHLYYDNAQNNEHEIWKHFDKTLRDFSPDVIGVSIYTCKLQSALNVIKLVKDFNPGIITCVGGAHVTALPESLLAKENIDSVFTGYSDLSFSQWLDEGCPAGKTEGALGEVAFKELPYPRRQALLFPEFYTPKDLGFIMTSRGCAGKCTFCSNTFLWEGKAIYRTSQSLVKELIELKDEWGVDDLFVGDASFTDIPAEAKRVAKILKDHRMRWKTEGRWPSLTQELLEYLIDCGCCQISVGLESGSEGLLKYMKKGCDKKLIREKAKMINSLGIDWHLFCMVGFPEETLESMQETLDMALELTPSSISLNSLSPLPGTGVYNDIPDITPEIASTVNQLNPNHSFSKHMDSNTFRNMFEKMIAIFDDYNKKNVSKEKAHVLADG